MVGFLHKNSKIINITPLFEVFIGYEDSVDMRLDAY